MEATSGSQPENVSSILTGVIGKPYNMILYRFSFTKIPQAAAPAGGMAGKQVGKTPPGKHLRENASGKTPQAAAPTGKPPR